MWLGFAQEVARSCKLPFDKLRANGSVIAPFVVSLSNHASAFRLLVQSRVGEVPLDDSMI